VLLVLSALVLYIRVYIAIIASTAGTVTENINTSISVTELLLTLLLVCSVTYVTRTVKANMLATSMFTEADTHTCAAHS
jgi:sulfopyruvate decarboxylase TPP-binding subunit